MVAERCARCDVELPPASDSPEMRTAARWCLDCAVADRPDNVANRTEVEPAPEVIEAPEFPGTIAILEGAGDVASVAGLSIGLVVATVGVATAIVSVGRMARIDAGLLALGLALLVVGECWWLWSCYRYRRDQATNQLPVGVWVFGGVAGFVTWFGGALAAIHYAVGPGIGGSREGVGGGMLIVILGLVIATLHLCRGRISIDSVARRVTHTVTIGRWVAWQRSCPFGGVRSVQVHWYQHRDEAGIGPPMFYCVLDTSIGRISLIRLGVYDSRDGARALAAGVAQQGGWRVTDGGGNA
jgi:hypothetical protein